MRTCTYFRACEFFNETVLGLPTLSRECRRRFCQGQEACHCARYQVASHIGSGYLPVDLDPSDTYEASRLIHEHRSSTQ